jgi:hypothetical protein
MAVNCHNWSVRTCVSAVANSAAACIALLLQAGRASGRSGVDVSGSYAQVGLKRKFSFSYFRDIYFAFREKVYEI